jgi:hypothetical protein
MAEATLRILPGQSDPRSISERLGVEPTRMVKRGELAEPGMLDTAATESEWSLCSRDAVQGDASAHLAWVLGRIGDKGKELHALRQSGLGVYLSVSFDVRAQRCLNLDNALLRQLAGVGLDVELRFAGA